MSTTLIFYHTIHIEKSYVSTTLIIFYHTIYIERKSTTLIFYHTIHIERSYVSTTQIFYDTIHIERKLCVYYTNILSYHTHRKKVMCLITPQKDISSKS
jgi:hypothetical protein